MKARLEFTVPVSNHGKTRKVKVFVYERLKDMYHAADIHIKKTGQEQLEHNYQAITHSFEIFTVDRKKDHSMPNVCVIRLCLGHLHSYIIAHEIAHAALHIYSLDCLEETDPVLDHINPNNEVFCHIVSELEHNIVSKLHRKGAYD